MLEYIYLTKKKVVNGRIKEQKRYKTYRKQRKN